MKVSVPDRSELEAVPSVSAQRDPGPQRSGPPRSGLTTLRSAAVRRWPSAGMEERRSHRPSTGSVWRAAAALRTTSRHSLDRHLRVQVGRPVDLPGVAVLTAVAPSRRSPGRSPILIVQVVQSRPDRPAFKPHAAAPRRDAAPDREEVKTPRPSRLQIEAVEPERESPIRPTASRPPTGRPATGRPPFRSAGSDRPGLVVLAKAAPASSGHERTGPDQIAQIVHDLIEQDRIGQDRTAPF